MNTHIIVKQSLNLQGEIQLVGAKNAVLVIMASLILTDGVSILTNVPCSDDVLHMIVLLRDLGAQISFFEEENKLIIDTKTITKYTVNVEIVKKMRASILVMGPLLARFGRVDIAFPGGCVIGSRPIDYHLKNFEKMGIVVDRSGEYLSARVTTLIPSRLVLEYPSVGATENIMMAAVLTRGTTRIINAALEPEVLDLIHVLRKMGARITIEPPATLVIEGVELLQAINHEIMFDRLEAGSLLLAAAVTGGKIMVPQAPAYSMDVFLMKLQEMGHHVEVGSDGTGISFKASKLPRAVSFKTAPYPGFPTDLQAPMMLLQCLAEGTSVIEEAVFENRLLHVRELQKMGAQIEVEHNKAVITGVEELYGTSVIATDIRAACALVLAGLVAKGTTIISGIHHLHRGYELLPKKLCTMGAHIEYRNLDSADISRQYEKEGINSMF